MLSAADIYSISGVFLLYQCVGVIILQQKEYGQIAKQLWGQSETFQIRFFKKKYLILVILLLPAFVIQAARVPNLAVLTVLYLFWAAVIVLLQNDALFQHWLISDEIEKCGRYQIQIRDTAVFESLHQVDVVCFDKTGVLTTRQMDVKNIYCEGDRPIGAGRPTGDRLLHLIDIACALCNDVLFFEKLEQANAIDKALISFAEKNGMDVKNLLLQSKRIYEKPFDSENRWMACGYKLKDLGVCYFAKGDPDVILNMCDTQWLPSDGTRGADSNFRLLNNRMIRSINQWGNTSIALAYASGSADASPQKYTFLCLLVLENSLEHGTIETIRRITDKGIRSIMLTGDRAETAVNIARECGMTENPGDYLTGNAIDRMAFAEIARQSDGCSVFARLLPSQKGIIIRLIQQKGHHVAMIGDGPNDGVALKVADVGISFAKNSSPIARRLSKILINELPDLLRLMEEACRIKRTNLILKWIRILMVIMILLGLYLRAVSLI
jgi:Ca2+-transporting ATPase